MIKGLYKNRLDSLVKEISIFKSYSNQANIDLELLQKEAMEFQLEIKSINETENITPAEKYELINKKLKDVEKIAVKVGTLYQSITDKYEKLNKEKDIFMKNCLEDHPDLTEQNILKEIDKRMNN